jgi:hypothetical protein
VLSVTRKSIIMPSAVASFLSHLSSSNQPKSIDASYFIVLHCVWLACPIHLASSYACALDLPVAPVAPPHWPRLLHIRHG